MHRRAYLVIHQKVFFLTEGDDEVNIVYLACKEIEVKSV